MSIVLIGGHERMHDEYKTIGARQGCKVKVFNRIPPRFVKSIGSPHAIVIFTNTVSHTMVLTAVKEAKKKNIPVVRCHTSSGNSLEEVLKQLRDNAC